MTVKRLRKKNALYVLPGQKVPFKESMGHEMAKAKKREGHF